VEELVKRVHDAVLSYERDNVTRAVLEALDRGINPLTVMNEGLSKAIVAIGEQFGREEIFLVELMVAAEACMAGMEIVKKKIADGKESAPKPKGVIVIGTVEGDIHNIGKDIVKTLLETAGFEVHDIGVDKPADHFVKTAVEVGAGIVASSALLTTTCPNQRAIEEALRGAGLKGRIMTIIGGAAANAAWREEIGADYYAPTATEGVQIIKEHFERT
jgi:corrinoid protein of di/trimethylamine methyltransferase